MTFRYFSLLTGLLMTTMLSAQSIDVQTFDYSSTTRDTMIAFPEGDHNRFEKIIMHYGMRCKDALVSTLSERNKGCGEWDFSCNTYVVDSTQVDSLKAISPDYVVSDYDMDDGPFQYTGSTTYTFHQTTLLPVAVVSGTPEDVRVLSEASEIEAPFGAGSDSRGVSMTIVYTSDELNMDAGPISAMEMIPMSGDATLDNLVVELQHVTSSVAEEVTEDAWQEAYNNHNTIGGQNRIYFHTPFEYDGSSHLAVRMHYDAVTAGAVALAGSDTGRESVLYKAQAYETYADFGSTGNLVLEEGLDALRDEVTVSFWHRGGPSLPVASTVMEAVDERGLRQINIHLPWGNRNVFWDCGNDGTGYDRINTVADTTEFRDVWNHWAFTKNAVTGEMHIYLNGALWHSGTGRHKRIDASALRIGSSHAETLRALAQLSDFRIWDKALTVDEINASMNIKLDATHPDYDRLLLNYPLDDLDTGVARDLSSQGLTAEVEGQVLSREWDIREIVTEVRTSSISPTLILDRGIYEIEVTEVIELDSVAQLPHKVEHYVLDGTDRILDDTQFLYAAEDQPIFNEDGIVIGSIPVETEGEIMASDLEHFSKAPMVFEVMSFVTPYGINLDFGEAGESWTFDVTHLGPILKGNKRFFMSQGGEWQEEMDIWFEFIEGQPTKDVLDIQQVWPCRQKTNHALILDDTRFEPRLLKDDPDVSQFMLRTTITGHGQQGEFIPRTHRMQLGILRDQWSVWTECADNPIFPQGGTWIFDRAGWCPGQASDTRFFDVTRLIKDQDPSETFLDYGITAVTGASNYLVSSQLVSYGPLNRQLDLSVKDIIYPSQKVEHKRDNPTCRIPVIVLENLGATEVNVVDLEFGIEGGETFRHIYTGRIDSEDEVTVELDQLPHWLLTEPGTFFVKIMSVNGVEDEYLTNDVLTSQINLVDHYEGDIIIEMRSNSQSLETGYRVTDEFGQQIFSRPSVTQPFRTYRDTLTGLQGCYHLEVSDTDDDGLEFFANNDGVGFFRIREIGGATKVLDPDFGKFSRYGFTAGVLSDTEEVLEEDLLSVYPNPSNGRVYVSGLGEWSAEVDFLITDGIGRTVMNRRKVDKYQLVDGELSALNDLGGGTYYLTVSDSRRSQTLRLVRIIE